MNNQYRILLISEQGDCFAALEAVMKEQYPNTHLMLAADGSSGWELVKTGKPDLVLVAMDLAGMTSYEVCREIKADEELRKTPVVFVAGSHHGKTAKLQALKVGADTFLTYPFDEIEIIVLMQTLRNIKKADCLQQEKYMELKKRVEAQTRDLRNSHTATLNILEDLTAENLRRREGEEALKRSERQYAFLAQSAHDLVKLNSIREIYAYTVDKLYELFEGRSYVALVEYNHQSGLWKMQNIQGVDKWIAKLSGWLGFDIRHLEGEITTQYMDTILSGKLRELPFDFPGLFNNRVSAKVGRMVQKALSIEKLYSIGFFLDDSIAGNITFTTGKKMDPLNADLIEAFILQVSNFLKKQKADEALRESEHKYRSLIEQMLEGLLVVDNEDIIKFANPMFCQMLGYEEDELLGKRGYDVLVSKEDRESIIQRNRDREKGLSERYEIDMIKKNGEKVTMLMSASPVKDHAGNVIGSMSGCINITEKKLIEDRLKNSDRVFHHSADMLCIAGFDGFFKVINPCWSKVLGWSDEELLSRPWNDFVHPEDLKGTNEVKVLLDGGEEVYQFENRYLCKDGHYRWLSWNSFPYPEEGVIFGVARDVTETKLSRMALEESQNRLATLMSNLLGMVYSCKDDADWTMSFVSRAAIEITGYLPEEIIDNRIVSYNQLIHPEDRGLVREQVMQSLENRDAFTIEYRIVTRSGAEKWVWERGRGVYGEDGALLRLEGIINDITDRKQTEAALRENESRLRKIIEILPVGLWFADKEGTLLSGNPAGVKIWGREPKVGVGNYDIFKGWRLPSGEPVAPEEWALAKTIRTGETIKDELLEIEGFDGKRRTILNYSAPITDHEGTLLGAIVVNNDITDRILAEKSLRINEERLNFSLEATLDGLWDWNLITHKAYFSPRYYTMLGYEPDEFEAGLKSWKDLLHPGDLPGCEAKLAEAIKNGIGFEMEFRMKTKDQRWKWIMGRGKVIEYAPSGEPLRMIGTHIDITERKNNDLIKQIHYNIARSVLNIENTVDLLEIIGYELGRLLDTTHFMLAAYNKDTETMCRVLFEEDRKMSPEWHVADSLSGQVVLQRVPLLLFQDEMQSYADRHNISLSGNIPVSWLGVPVFVEGEVAGAMVIQSYRKEERYGQAEQNLLELVAHETGVFLERKKILEDLIAAKEKAEESDKLKTAFINNISHEIRTPLNGIIGFGQFLAEQDLSPEQRADYYHKVQKSSKRLMQTVADYMDIALLVTGTMDVHPADFALFPAIAPTLDMVRGLCDEKDVDFILNIPGDLEQLMVHSDAELVIKILQKLTDNALKFTDSGSITFGVGKTIDRLLFHVEDTGRGIAPEKLEEIFRLFNQEEISMTRGHEGSGLGLSIAKGIAQLLGGTIAVRSQKGRGSAFTLELPVGMLVDKAEDNVELVAIDAEKDRPVVLLAEDDESNYLYLEVVIKNAGCEYLLALNGQEAVDLCRERSDIDIVLMDVKMPVMNGLEATQLIHEFRPDLPVIAITAYAQTGDEQRILAAGCTEYHTKPIKPDVLKQILKRYTRQR